MDIRGKSALVTGGASGIGLACVKELLMYGAKHVAVCDCDAENGENTLRELEKEFGPGRVIFTKTDVTKAEEFEDAFKVAISTFKTLDIVINNAGICDEINWDRMIAINFSAMVRGTLLAIQYMGKEGGGVGGVLCNTASMAGVRPSDTVPIYAATKHGVVGLSRSFGLPSYFQRTGVRVVTICPGMTDTAILAKTIPQPHQINKWTARTSQSDLTSLLKPEDIAGAIMMMIKTSDSGTVWTKEIGNPLTEVVALHESL